MTYEMASRGRGAAARRRCSPRAAGAVPRTPRPVASPARYGPGLGSRHRRPGRARKSVARGGPGAAGPDRAAWAAKMTSHRSAVSAPVTGDAVTGLGATRRPLVSGGVNCDRHAGGGHSRATAALPRRASRPAGAARPAVTAMPEGKPPDRAAQSGGAGREDILAHSGRTDAGERQGHNRNEGRTPDCRDRHAGWRLPYSAAGSGHEGREDDVAWSRWALPRPRPRDYSPDRIPEQFNGEVAIS